MAPVPIVVLISGEGTNLQAIIDAAAGGSLPVRIRAVISNRPGARGLVRARRAGIETGAVDHTRFTRRSDFDEALRQAIDRYHPELVVLAGFMRVLGQPFVDHYRDRLINIHPSLLPAFPGLHTHRRALEAGVAEHGASVHFVTNQVDGGPVIMRVRVPVRPGDDTKALGARVLRREHALYVKVIGWFAEGRLRLIDGVPQLDGRPLAQPLDYDEVTGR